VNVRELITYLQTLEQDRRICIRGYEGGYDDVGSADEVKLKLNVNKEDDWYFGRHDSVLSNEPFDELAYVL
jgi:hypothetical protein